MVIAAGESQLQSVIVRPVNVGVVVDELQVRIFGKKGTSRLVPCCRVSGVERRLVNILDAGKLCSMIAHIGRVQRQLAGKSVLDTECPGGDEGGLVVANNDEDVARAG